VLYFFDPRMKLTLPTVRSSKRVKGAALHRYDALQTCGEVTMPKFFVPSFKALSHCLPTLMSVPGSFWTFPGLVLLNDKGSKTQKAPPRRTLVAMCAD
jgi:hypothetical protein